MPIDILMPALSPTMEKGNLVQWLKAVGDKVCAGDALVEIETDKATMEVQAAADGVLLSIVVPMGTRDIAVNQLIGSIAAEGESVGKPGDPSRFAAPTTDASLPANAPVLTHAPAVPAINGADAGRIFASPIARRLMVEAGLDPATVAGSGPRGRILERDIGAALAAARTAVAAAHGEAKSNEPHAEPVQRLPALSDDGRVRALFEAGSYVEAPHDSMRLTIARRLSEAKLTVPHFYLSADCAIDALLALRQQFNDAAPASRDGERAYRLSVNDFVIRALALALMQVPDANVSFTETAMLRHARADIAVAVAVPGGLMTPIVRGAETKTLAAISNEVKELAARARSRQLRPDEYQGGTSSVSNLGMYGVKDFAAIVNPPQASILAVGKGEQRVIARDGAPAVATLMSVTLSADHRAIDGATGAQLLSAFKALIERPMATLV